MLTVKGLEVVVLLGFTSAKYKKTAQSTGDVAVPYLYGMTRGPSVAEVRAVCITRGGGAMNVKKGSVTGSADDIFTVPGTDQGVHTRSKASSGYLHKNNVTSQTGSNSELVDAGNITLFRALAYHPNQPKTEYDKSFLF